MDLLLVFLVGCATPLPPSALPWLRVPPGAYEAPLQLAQRLTVLEAPAPGDTQVPAERHLDALLQLDRQTLRLAALALNQRVLSLTWDGQQVQVQRHPLLPVAVDPERVLRDIALVYAPLAALRATLPPNWTLEQDAQGRRSLWQSGQLRVQVHLLGPRVVEIDNRAERYRLRIESTSLE